MSNSLLDVVHAAKGDRRSFHGNAMDLELLNGLSLLSFAEDAAEPAAHDEAAKPKKKPKASWKSRLTAALVPSRDTPPAPATDAAGVPEVAPATFDLARSLCGSIGRGVKRVFALIDASTNAAGPSRAFTSECTQTAKAVSELVMVVREVREAHQDGSDVACRSTDDLAAHVVEFVRAAKEALVNPLNYLSTTNVKRLFDLMRDSVRNLRLQLDAWEEISASDAAEEDADGGSYRMGLDLATGSSGTSSAPSSPSPRLAAADDPTSGRDSADAVPLLQVVDAEVSVPPSPLMSRAAVNTLLRPRAMSTMLKGDPRLRMKGTFAVIDRCVVALAGLTDAVLRGMSVTKSHATASFDRNSKEVASCLIKAIGVAKDNRWTHEAELLLDAVSAITSAGRGAMFNPSKQKEFMHQIDVTLTALLQFVCKSRKRLRWRGGTGSSIPDPDDSMEASGSPGHSVEDNCEALLTLLEPHVPIRDVIDNVLPQAERQRLLASLTSLLKPKPQGLSGSRMSTSVLGTLRSQQLRTIKSHPVTAAEVVRSSSLPDVADAYRVDGDDQGAQGKPRRPSDPVNWSPATPQASLSVDATPNASPTKAPASGFPVDDEMQALERRYVHALRAAKAWHVCVGEQAGFWYGPGQPPPSIVAADADQMGPLSALNVTLLDSLSAATFQFLVNVNLAGADPSSPNDGLLEAVRHMWCCLRVLTRACHAHVLSVPVPVQKRAKAERSAALAVAEQVMALVSGDAPPGNVNHVLVADAVGLEYQAIVSALKRSVHDTSCHMRVLAVHVMSALVGALEADTGCVGRVSACGTVLLQMLGGVQLLVGLVGRALDAAVTLRYILITPRHEIVVTKHASWDHGEAEFQRVLSSAGALALANLRTQTAKMSDTPLWKDKTPDSESILWTERVEPAPRTDTAATVTQSKSRKSSSKVRTLRGTTVRGLKKQTSLVLTRSTDVQVSAWPTKPTAKRSIRAATLNRLIVELTCEVPQDPLFVQTFLMTYQSFTTPDQLLDKLVQRFNVPSHEAPDGAGIIKARVVSFIRAWVDQQYFDLSGRVIDRLSEFIHDTLQHDDDLSAMTYTLSQQLAEKNALRLARMRHLFSLPSTDLSVLVRVGESAVQAFLKWPCVEIARQMTLIDWAMFERIEPPELFNQCWSRKERNAPNVKALIDRMNMVSYWIPSMLLWAERMTDRCTLFGKFVSVATQLRKVGNFHSLMAVLAGLGQSSIQRLRFTLTSLMPSHRQELEQLSVLMNPQQSYKVYREAVDRTRMAGPCIPYLGVCLQDLTFVEEGNPPMLGSLINFERLTLMHDRIKGLLAHQSTAYTFPLVQPLHDMLTSLPHNDEKDLYELSLAREPREAALGDIQ